MRLRRSDLTGPGIRRIRSGRGFRYLDSGCQPVPAAELARIKDLVIPPAWKDVWICPWPNGHIQAVGFDAAGRRQYLYHPRWRERRDKQKHDHVLDFAAALPDARQVVIAQLAGRGLTRERVLAAAVRLLDFAYYQRRGWHQVHSSDVNDHLKELTGLEVSAKDFRTWNATVLAAVGLAVSPVPRRSVSGRRRAVARVVKEVSEYLGNTPAVCRASYIDPRVIERYERGDTIVDALDQLGETETETETHTQTGALATQGAIEEAVLNLLRPSG